LYTDPSGYTWFTQFGGWLGKVGRPILETAVGINAGIAAVAGVAALTVGTGGLDLIAMGVIAGIGGGIATGALSTAFSGGNFNDYINSMAEGAVIGAQAGLVGACVGGGVNSLLAGGNFMTGFTGAAKIVATGFWSGLVTGLAGGFSGGFIAGFESAGFTLGDNINDMLKEGLIFGCEGAAFSGVLGGILGGIDAEKHNKNFWTGFGGTQQPIVIGINNDGTGKLVSEKEYSWDDPTTKNQYTINLQNNPNVTFDGNKVTINLPSNVDGIYTMNAPEGSTQGSFVFKNSQISFTCWEDNVSITLHGWRYINNPVTGYNNIFSLISSLFCSRQL
jgi:hypothetical protein